MSTGLAILHGLSQGAEKAATNLYNINQAKGKLEQEKKLQDLQIKKAKIELDQAEILGDPEVVKQQRELLKKKMSIQKNLYDMATMQIDQEVSKNKNNLQNFQKTMNAVGQYLDLSELGFVKQPNQKEAIMKKIANEEQLTTGEQQLYDDLMKKKTNNSDDIFNEIFNDEQ